MKSKEYAHDKIKIYNSNSTKKLEEISLKIEASLQISTEAINIILKKRYDEATNYYIKLTEQYNAITTKEEPIIKKFYYNLDLTTIKEKNSKKQTNKIDTALMAKFNPIGLITGPNQEYKRKKEKIDSILTATKENLKTTFKEQKANKIKSMKH